MLRASGHPTKEAWVYQPYHLTIRPGTQVATTLCHNPLAHFPPLRGTHGVTGSSAGIRSPQHSQAVTSMASSLNLTISHSARLAGEGIGVAPMPLALADRPSRITQRVRGIIGVSRHHWGIGGVARVGERVKGRKGGSDRKRSIRVKGYRVEG